MNADITQYISNAAKWGKEMEQLRTLLLGYGLTEEMKWNKPCYSYKGKNIAIIQGFKEYLALLFFKGYLLADSEGILIKTGENTRVGRQIRFNTVKEITELEPVLRAYIFESIEIEKSGIKAGDEPSVAPDIPVELQNKFASFSAFKTAFYALTPGRQRAYLIHFSQPKQAKTREARIEKYIPQILDGKGLNDDYLIKKQQSK